jgi:hypothetical protein
VTKREKLGLVMLIAGVGAMVEFNDVLGRVAAVVTALGVILFVGGSDRR